MWSHLHQGRQMSTRVLGLRMCDAAHKWQLMPQMSFNVVLRLFASYVSFIRHSVKPVRLQRSWLRTTLKTVLVQHNVSLHTMARNTCIYSQICAVLLTHAASATEKKWHIEELQIDPVKCFWPTFPLWDREVCGNSLKRFGQCLSVDIYHLVLSTSIGRLGRRALTSGFSGTILNTTKPNVCPS